MCRHRSVLPIVLPSPIARAADLLAVVRARLEGCSLAAPVLAVTLRAPELVRAPTRTLDLLAPEPKAERALPRIVAELTAEFGEGVTGTLALVDTWSPSERTRVMPFDGTSLDLDHTAACDDTSVAPAATWSRPGDMPSALLGRALVTSAIEPSRLVHPAPVPREALVGAQHLARVEEVEWWRRQAHAAYDGQHCDLFAAWIGESLAWLELRRTRNRNGYASEVPLLRGWMD
jgi:hypothetical protein